jgi:hypothetical protein
MCKLRDCAIGEEGLYGAKPTPASPLPCSVTENNIWFTQQIPPHISDPGLDKDSLPSIELVSRDLVTLINVEQVRRSESMAVRLHEGLGDGFGFGLPLPPIDISGFI